jgi:predicted PurR-regulated permease PerM
MAPSREGTAEDEVIEVEAGALSGLFAAPQWLRDLGISAWLLFGVGAALLANGIFQQMVQPIAYGAVLKLHPLAVLIG